MTRTPRIGKSMRHALQLVAAAGGAIGAQLDLAEAVGPNGSRKHGYQIVNRCLAAGLLIIDPHHPAHQGRRGAGAVLLTDTGRDALEG